MVCLKTIFVKKICKNQNKCRILHARNVQGSGSVHYKNRKNENSFMKKHLIVISLLSVILAACMWKQPMNPILVLTDSLMHTHPDSALWLLQQMNVDDLHGQVNHAYYALLLTQARDKNYIWAKSDSLIRVAARYYDSTEDIAMRARVHYLWGSYYRDMNDCGQAIREYFTAIPLAEAAGDKRLQMVLCNNAGLIYYMQVLNEKADSLYRVTEKLAIDLNDSICWAEALSQQGMVDINRGKAFYPAAEKKMLRAYQLGQDVKNRVLMFNITIALSTLYSHMNNGENVLRFANESQVFSSGNTLQILTASLLGEGYYLTQQYDSALYYLNKALASKAYNIKSDIYMRLADIAKEQGDLTTSIEMERIYSAYKDSVLLLNQTNKMIEVEKDLQMQRQQEESRRVVVYNYIIYIGGISVTLILVMIYLRKRYRRRIIRIQQEKKEILNQKRALLQESSTLKEALQKEVAEKSALRKEVFDYSRVNGKIERIIQDYKKQDSSSKELTDDDWQAILVEVNQRWDNITVRLSVHYPSLSKSDIRVCCLTLLDIQRAHVGFLMNCSRSAYYKREDNILEKKMGYAHKITTLKDVLNTFS